MKKNIKKIILITLAVIPGIILSFCLAVIILLYLMLESSSQYTMNVFEINNDKYTLKIIEENYLRGIGVGSDLFSYENEDVKEKICAVLAGYVWDTTNPFVAKHKHIIENMAYAINNGLGMKEA